jgi:Mannosyltransferase (PIG-M)
MIEQYFLWYLIFLPFYLPFSSLLKKPAMGITAGVLWVLGQVRVLSLSAKRPAHSF